jgi:hypothetical protein
MMLLRICTLGESHFYRPPTPDYHFINYSMVNLERYYSRQLLMLIGRCLNEQPQQRISFAAIREFYSPLMRGEYEVNISVGREMKKSMKPKTPLRY